MERRSYPISVVINGKTFTELIIDPHYIEKHQESVTDEIIIELVKMLNGREFAPDKISSSGIEYYVEDKMKST